MLLLYPLQNQSDEEPKIKKVKFPCKDCLVSAAHCKKLCDKVEMDDEKIKEFVVKQAEETNNLVCIDCGCTDWYEGPCGGLAQNIKCAGCGHCFNMGLPLFFQRISNT